MKKIKSILGIFYLSVFIFGVSTILTETKAEDPCSVHPPCQGYSYHTDGECCVTEGPCEDICS